MPSSPPTERARQPGFRRQAAAVFQPRFLKFGMVGGSGVLVNLGVLYFCQEHLLTGIASFSLRLNASLLIAIFLATVNNFCWNRIWTWHDRPRHSDRALLAQFGRYLLGTSLASAMQILGTWGLAFFIHYLAANMIAISLAALGNYLLSDFWVFAALRTQDRIGRR